MLASEWAGRQGRECQCSLGTQFENHCSMSKVACFHYISFMNSGFLNDYCIYMFIQTGHVVKKTKNML